MKSMDSAKVEILDEILVKCVSCNRRRPTPRKLKPKMTRSLRNYEKIQKIRNHAFENSAKVWGTVPESQDPKVELLHPKLSNSDWFLEKVKQNLKEIMYIYQKSQFSHSWPKLRESNIWSEAMIFQNRLEHFEIKIYRNHKQTVWGGHDFIKLIIVARKTVQTFI